MSYPAYPEYRDSGVPWLGQVPSHWDVKRLKHFSRIIMGQSPASENCNQENQGPPFLQGCAEFGGKSPTPNQWCQVATKFADFGDILLSVRAPVGAINIADQAYGIGRGLCAIRAGVVEPNYLHWSLETERAQLSSMATGSTYEAVSTSQVGNLLLVTPTFCEQKKIAEFLDRETAKIDALMAEQEKLIALLKEKRQAVISHAVTKGLDPNVPMKDSGIEWIREIPKHWDITRLKSGIKFLTSGSRGWAEHYSDEGAIFIRIGNLTRDSIELDLSDIQRVDVPVGAEGERTRLRSGDVLFSITAYLGSVAVAPEQLETAYVSQHVALVRLEERKFLPSWVAFVTLSQVGKSYLASQGYGGTKIQLGLDDIANFAMPRPPIEEQRSIIEFVKREISKLSSLISEAHRAIDILKERRAALISAAVTGKIDVRGIAAMEAA